MKPDGDIYCAAHLKNAFYNRVENLDRAIRILSTVEFCTIVCTGLSGALFASPLSIIMGKQLVVIRKEGDKNHSWSDNERNCSFGKVGPFIIVDDLIDTGATVGRIKRKMSIVPFATHVGTYLYDNQGKFLPVTPEEIDAERYVVESLTFIKTPSFFLP